MGAAYAIIHRMPKLRERPSPKIAVTSTAVSPLPRGPHSLTREQVASNQRRRLIDGMIDTVGAKGYAASTVADVIKRAGVSRKAFYEHFANKEECFLATYDSIAAVGQHATAEAFRRAEGLPDRANTALGDLFDLAISRPAALRVLMIEIAATGPPGIERRERLAADYEGILRRILGLPAGPGPIPNPVLRGVVGGMVHVLYGHLRRGQRTQVRELVPALTEWAISYWPPPAAIIGLKDPTPEELHLDLSGGRAPGSLSLGAAASGRRKLPRGENGMSRSFVVHSQRERILDAVANLTATKGYAALTVEGIATEAAVSLQAFYEHFSGKEDAFLVAYEIGHDKSLALVEQAYNSQPDWRLGVRAGIAALFRFMAAEPTYAHIAMMDVLAATDRTAERAIKGASSYSQMLLPGLDYQRNGKRPPGVTVEAIAGGLFELCLHHTLQGRMRELPTMVPRATYFALTPFIGTEAASEIATAPWGES
jgi:AcrR family transcriptional regulator